MTKMIFVNLPVADLAKSIAFYTAIGFEEKPQMSGDGGACMVWSEAIHVMLLTHDKWRTFTTRAIPPSTQSEVSLAVTVDDKAAVDVMIAAADAHGGTIDVNPPEDHGFMYQRTLCDPDGHIWEPFWMDITAMPK